jgi:hypothetical protein
MRSQTSCTKRSGSVLGGGFAMRGGFFNPTMCGAYPTSPATITKLATVPPVDSIARPSAAFAGGADAD